jgi:hypothetical protein
MKHGSDRTATNKYTETALNSAEIGQQDFESGKFEFSKVGPSGADDSALLSFHEDQSFLLFDFRTRDPKGWPSCDADIRLLPKCAPALGTANSKLWDIKTADLRVCASSSFRAPG